ncbi:UNVERIFIED_CONTAM: hypothetical protein FKN15_043044 [Acipenser sinensis]
MVTVKHVYEIARVKAQDESFALQNMSLENVVRCIIGSARSLGIRVPTVSYFLKAAAGIERGAGKTGHEVAGMVTVKHVYEIARVKAQDESFALQNMSLENVVRCIIGSARSLGIRVVNE